MPHKRTISRFLAALVIPTTTGTIPIAAAAIGMGLGASVGIVPAAIFTTPAQRPSQAASFDYAYDYANGISGVVLAAIITS